MTGLEKLRISDFTLEEYFAEDIHTNLHLFSMHGRRVKGTWFFPSHEHFQYELNYVLEGQQEFTINGKKCMQQAGDLMFIHPGEVHFNRSGDGKEFSYFCLHFQIDDRQLLPVLSRSKQAYYPSDCAMTRRITPHLNRLIEFSKHPGILNVQDRMSMTGELFQLFGSMADVLLSEKASQDEPLENDRLAVHIATRIERLVKNMHVHGPSEDGDRTFIHDIASDLDISLSHCNRIFKKRYMMSPRQYLSSLMLQKAKHLLRQKDLSIDHVGELLGYREIAHFSRQFKRWAGMSPAYYRQMTKGKEQSH